MKRIVEYRQNCEKPSNWTVSLRREGGIVAIGLHYGDKELPTHEAYFDLNQFADITREFQQDALSEFD